MIYLIQANGYDMNMYAKIQDLTLYRFLQLNTWKFELWEFSTMQ
jgi:hypothetical protein